MVVGKHVGDRLLASNFALPVQTYFFEIGAKSSGQVDRPGSKSLAIPPALQLAVRGQVVDARAERAQTAESMTNILTMQWTQAFALPVLFGEAHDVA